jgi:tetratricopeptide (TPR) repeat protein
MSNDWQHIKDLLQTKKRRLWKLEEQAARHGPDCPPHITLEIEDLLREIAELEASVKAAAPPLPPQPYFAHPYPLQENFTGRARERKMLTGWLSGGQWPVLALVAMGGMGKSALTWAWLQRDVLGHSLPGLAPDPPEVVEPCRVPEARRPEGVLWWSFYEREARFAVFLDYALAYASAGNVDAAAVSSAYDKVQHLVTLLQQRRLLLILDGFERELRAYASLNAAYQGDELAGEAGGDFRGCTDRYAGDFLRWLAASPLQSRVLLTSRLLPHELEGLAGCRREELTSLDPEDAVIFFQARGVRGTRAEIQAACAPYGYHPLALRLLAGMIVHDPARPGEVSLAAEYSPLPDLVPREHHILALAYAALRPPLRELLSRLAAFRSPVQYEAVKAISLFEDERELKAALRELVERGLLLFDRERRRNDLHPIVRGYAYDRLADKEGVHTRLRDYFAALPAPQAERVGSVEDLAPVIELYHHTVHAGRYDEAFDLFRDRLHAPLYYRLGAYQTCIELLRALFPGAGDPLAGTLARVAEPGRARVPAAPVPAGPAALPRLKKEGDQAWTLNELANSYGLCGQSRLAVPLLRQHTAIREKQGNKVNLAIGLGNLADDQLKLGELAAAEGNLRRRIELCHEIEDEFREAVGHQELGRLLTYQGAFDESEKVHQRAIELANRLHNQQIECVVQAYSALRALLMNEHTIALQAARRARELAELDFPGIGKLERDIIQAEWLLGAALVALALAPRPGGHPHLPNLGDGVGGEGLLARAEIHLTQALTRCRRINMVDLEPDILLAWARWHEAKGHHEQAGRDAEAALTIADRCEYRLKQADCHNLLARLALGAGDRRAARHHAQTARERAWCDGPPHCYQPALEEAERLLAAIA